MEKYIIKRSASGIKPIKGAIGLLNFVISVIVAPIETKSNVMISSPIRIK